MRVIGVDVGGTNTDAVCIGDNRIIATAKVPTTPDIEGGLLAALAQVRGREPIDRVHIGTTAFTNALVERRGLAPAAAVRIGAPVSESLPPMIDWPPDLRATVANPVFFVRGGREYDGRPIRPLDRAEIERVAAALAHAQVTQVAVTAVFGTSYPDDELRVAEWLHAANPELGLSLSHGVGRFGILERENATLLNAMLRPLAARTVAAYRAAVPGALYISQNDGTVMRADQAADLPVFTIASGPTNSLRGAAMLTGLSDAIVFDVGGTTTDVGVLRGGYPQLAGLDLAIAGVRTNFRMPDLCSVGIGGGSLVDRVSGSVGPKSVGFRLTEAAIVFGGDTLTLTDLAVAAGRVEIGDRARVRDVGGDVIARVDAHLRARFTRLLESFDQIGRQLPVVLVGGGAPLVGHVFADIGRDVIAPEYASVANAYGAAIAQVGGEVDLTFSLTTITRAEALARAEREAHRRAAEAGAGPGSIRTVELEDAALTYLASDALR
ncbi:MAG TPA: hydantoinase/oxoprolinase family protein, partial [Candidatus Dormibacteraeota bacterium]|nr:hydantoinase/oxoprolinase family protein [Candidatus Dormibacteraeota bacterium]